MKRSGPPQRKTRLRSRSARAISSDKARKDCRELVILRAQGECEACPLWDPTAPAHPGEDVHEVLPRSSGGSITDPSNGLYVCRRAHAWVHDNPKQAERLGLLERA